MSILDDKLSYPKPTHHRSISCVDIYDTFAKPSPNSQTTLSQEPCDSSIFDLKGTLEIHYELKLEMQQIQKHLDDQINTAQDKKQKIRKKMLQLFQDSKKQPKVPPKDSFRSLTTRERIFTPILSQRKAQKPPLLKPLWRPKKLEPTKKPSHTKSLIIHSPPRANKKNISYCNINELS